MGRKPISPELVKTNITISIRKETIDKLRTVKNYNALIQKLLDDYFSQNM